MALHEWSPATQLARLDRDFEDILNHFMSHDWGSKPSSKLPHPPSIESFLEAGQLIIRVDLPGVDPKDVNIKVDGQILIIKGFRAAAFPEQHRSFIQSEINYGNFERAISIPKGVKEKDLCAVYRNGVLELTVPLTQGIEIRRIPVLMPKRASEVARRQ